MDVDDQMEEESTSSGPKRKNESSSDNESDENHPNQLFDILSAPGSTKIKEDFIVRREKSVDIDNKSKFYCKILKFSTDWSLPEVLLIIENLDREEYPNLFIFIIETENAVINTIEKSPKRMKFSSELDQIKDKLYKFAENRPLILQFTSMQEKTTTFYFKDENASNLEFEIIDIQEGLSSSGFPFFISVFLKGKIENSLDIFENFLEVFENSTLILRFFRTLDLHEKFWNNMILRCAECGSKNDLFAALDITFENNGMILSNEVQQWLSNIFLEEVVDDTKHNQQDTNDSSSNLPGQNKEKSFKETSVMLAAIEGSNTSIIDYLIKDCTHLIQKLPFHHQILISTAAFEKNQDDLVDLLKLSDYPFPNNFKINENINNNLKEIIKHREEFKNAILEIDMQKVTDIINTIHGFKYAYNVDNMSVLELALKSAIKTKNCAIYFYLKQNGFESPNFKNLEDAQLNDKDLRLFYDYESNQRAKVVNEALPNQQKIINIMCNKSLIHNRKTSKELENEYRKKIKKWFEDIYKIEYCSDMLKIAASCGQLKIIFDFENIKVEIDYVENSDSEGKLIISQKLIFIGAKSSETNPRDKRIKGTLAHEICHYVIHLVFENRLNPYYLHNTKLMHKFKKISEAIDKWSKSLNEPGGIDDDCNGIISNVFQLYIEAESDAVYAELIVRVVQILVEFADSEDKIKQLQKKYLELFTFWMNHVMPEIQIYFSSNREYVRKMNRTFGLLKTIESRKLELSTSRNIKQLDDHKFCVVRTNVPRLLFIDIYDKLVKTSGSLLDAKNVFIGSKVHENGENFADLKKLLMENSGLKFIFDCSGGVCDELKDIIVNPGSCLIFVVQDANQATNAKEILQKIEHEYTEEEKNYTWSDLTAGSQKQLLKTKLNFQNNSQITLSDLIMKDVNLNQAADKYNDVISSDLLKIIDDQLLNLLMEKKQIEVNRIPEDPLDFRLLYQSRRFDSPYEYSCFEEEFLLEVNNEKYVLISDIAGNGKSWVMRSISKTLMQQNPTQWVIYIDLKQFIEKLKAKEIDKLKFSTFIIENILKLGNEFESKIFQKMYEIGKVIIFFDGFDEIAPNYAEFVLNLAQVFEQNGGNQLWIATRDYFKFNLQQELQVRQAHSLGSFSSENGAEFIAKSWMLSEPETKEITTKDAFEDILKKSIIFKDYQEMAKKIIEKMSPSGNQSIGMPQIYKIIAEISKDNKKATMSLSQAKMYESLVDRLYKRWISEKGEIREQANIKSQKYDLNFYRFHQYLAIKSYFKEYIGVFFVGYNAKEWPNEEIIACGIVGIVYGKYQFLHETFREYFVADFITNELKKALPHQEALNMFVEVMTVEKFGVVRMFLNETLESSVLRKIEPEMQKLKRNKMFQDMNSFADIFKRGHLNLIEFIIKVLKTRKGGKISRVLIENACTMLEDSNQFIKFQDILLKHCNNDFLQKLVIEKAVFLNLINSNLEFEYFDKFFIKVKEKIGSKIVNEGIKMRIKDEGNIFYVLLKSLSSQQSKLKCLLDFLAKHISIKEIYDMMSNCDENEATVLHVILKNFKEPLECWREIKKYFNDQNQHDMFKNLVSREDSRQSNILHYSLEMDFGSSKEFLELMFEMFDKETMNEMLTKNNLDGICFMHKVMKSFDKVHDNSRKEVDEDKIEHLIKVIDEKLGSDQLGEILNIENKEGVTVFQLAVKRGLQNCQIYKILWQSLMQTCKTEEFLKILNKSHSWYCDNILQVVARNDSTNEILKFMIEEMETFSECEGKRKLLSHQGKNERILLDILAINEEHFDLYKKLWKIYHQNFNPNEFLKITDRFLFRLIQNNNKRLIEHTWNEIKNLKDQNELQIAHYLRSQNLKYNLLELSSKNSPEVKEWFKKVLEDYKINLEIENFSEFSKKFENCIRSKSHEQLEQLLREYEDIFRNQNVPENFKYLLMMPDPQRLQRNFLHRAVLCDNVEFHKALWKRILMISDWNELQSLKNRNLTFDDVLQIFEDGHTILQSAVRYSTNDILKLLIQILEAIASTDEIKEILSILYLNGTLLHLAASCNKSSEHHETLWLFISKYFEQKEMLKLIEKFYKNRYSLLQFAVRFNTKEIVDLTWSKYTNLINRDERVEYLRKNFNQLFEWSQENYKHKVEVQKWLQIILVQYLEILNKSKTEEEKISHPAVIFDDDDKENNHVVDDCNYNDYDDDYDDDATVGNYNNAFDDEIVVSNNSASEESNSDFDDNEFNASENEEQETADDDDDDDNGKININYVKELLNLVHEKENIFNQLCNSSTFENIEAEQFLKNLQKYLKFDEILNLMKNCNGNGENIFHICIRTNNGTKLVKWFQATQKLFSSRELFMEFLFLDNCNNHSFLDLSGLNNSIEFHQTIWDYLKDYLTNFEILKICVHKKDINGNNFVHLLIKNNKNSEIVEYIFSIFKSKLTQDEFKELLSCRGYQGKNLLQIAILNKRNTEIFKKVFQILKEFYNSDFAKILFEVDNFRLNIFGITVCYSSGEHFDLLIESLYTIITHQEIKKTFFNFTSGQHLLNIAISNNKDLTLHEALWKHIDQYYTRSEIKNMLQFTDQHGNNFMHFAVLYNSKEVAEFSWKNIKNYLNVNERISYLNAKGFEGKKIQELSKENKFHPEIQDWFPSFS